MESIGKGSKMKWNVKNRSQIEINIQIICLSFSEGYKLFYSNEFEAHLWNIKYRNQQTTEFMGVATF